MTSDPEETSGDLGEGLPPGASHYRAYVGPPEDYDLVAAMTFSLLAALGLRQHHSLLDIGCGSLRVGRLLIPYLNRGHYTGFEPNAWLVDEGIARECGKSQIEIKMPRFVLGERPSALEGRGPFDFALAQSIFSHAGLDLIAEWLSVLEPILGESGVLAATFLQAERDSPEPGWVYPDCVAYRAETLETLARQHGFGFRLLDWRHPRQTWSLFFRPGFPVEQLRGGQASWNRALDLSRPRG